MGYYIVEIFPRSRYLTTIVTEFGKLRYNRVSMGLCAYHDIFQAKLYELLSDIKGVKMYIINILVLGKGGLSQHIDQIIIIFSRLRATGLKLNAPKCRCPLNEIPYLG